MLRGDRTGVAPRCRESRQGIGVGGRSGDIVSPLSSPSTSLLKLPDVMGVSFRKAAVREPGGGLLSAPWRTDVA